MSDTISEELNHCVRDALESESLEKAIEHLARGFTLFSTESKRLQDVLQETKKELSYEKERLKRKEEDVFSVTSFLNRILKNMDQGVVFVNNSGNILSISAKAEELLQVFAKPLLLKEYWNHFPDDYFGFSVRDALNYHLHQATSYITVQDRKMQRREIEVKTKLFKEGDIRYQGILILLKDITEIQKYAEVAKRNDRLKDLGQLTSTVAHEIKNPLGGIRGYAMLLERELHKLPQLKEMATHITDGTKTLDRLLSKILSYAKPVEISVKSTELANFIRRLIRLVKMDPEHPKNIHIEFHISEEPLFVPIDSDLLQQALLNLILNAKQAMDKGGKLTVSLMKNERHCVITLSDTGCGIDEKDLKEIFSPFFTTKQKGHGLGLTETVKIIHAHFGSIDVRSQKGRGTTFTIQIPLTR